MGASTSKFKCHECLSFDSQTSRYKVQFFVWANKQETAFLNVD